MKRWIACQKIGFGILLLTAFAGCQKQVQTSIAQSVATNPPDLVKANTTVNANAICDYNFDETTLTNAGWTKTFEDNFDVDLSKWNIWTGGAYNNELEYYQAANLQVANGNLVITAKKQTVTGATT